MFASHISCDNCARHDEEAELAFYWLGAARIDVNEAIEK
jgi:hypothetical protein